MPLTEAGPIVEQISASLLTRLRVMETGVWPMTPVSQVVRPKRNSDYRPQNMQIVLTEDDPEPNPELNRPGNPPAIAWDLKFNIRCHITPSEKDPRPLMQQVNRFAADVIRAVCQGSAHWHSFGGLAVNAKWAQPERIEADGGITGVNVPLIVTYRVAENDPYVNRR